MNALFMESLYFGKSGGNNMNQTLYIQTDRNVKVTKEKVLLGEIATLSCSDSKVLNRNMARPVTTLPKGKYGRYTMSAIDLVKAVAEEEENVDVTHIGEPDFVITFEDPKGKNAAVSILKTIFVSLVAFFGMGFSMMTFNTDVDVEGLFDNIHTMFTGRPSSGFSVLEITYSIGIGIGVVFFFNHFGRRKITQDPTPMEVQMRLYEDDVDSTILEQERRKEKK